MPFLILAIFVGVPIVEIAVFIKVGGLLGLWPTLAIVILTAIIGTTLLRLQGLSTLQRAQAALARNELPLREVFDGLCLLLAGALLLTPGFVTDAAGILLFIPPVRDGIRHLVGRYILSRHDVHVEQHWQRREYRGPNDGDIIDGDYETVDDSDDDDRQLPRR